MASETFTFSCPHCQTRLTVPVSLAGISGPCPSCRTPITAPRPEPEPRPVPAPLPVSGPVPAAREEPTAPIATPEAERATGKPETVSLESVLPDRKELPAAGGPRIRPEPRQRPDRPSSPPVSTRRSTEDQSSRGFMDSPPESGRRSYRLIHLLFPMAFLAMAATLVGALVYFYGPGAPGPRLKEANRPPVIPPPAKVQPSPAPLQAGNGSAELPTPPDPAPGRGQSRDTGTSESSGESPAIIAYALLESFLQAKDAASRVGMVEPATSEQELGATLLKGPLPEFTQIFSDLPQHRPDEKMTDFPYRVSFVVKDAPNVDYAILVRQRGTQPPRIFLPAFLDLVGGRLAAFTREPNTSAPTLFHVYLEPIDGCYEKDVPGADRKFTFKLLSSPFGKETARAYAANASRFRSMVEEPTYPIRWGMRRRATITLEWNHKEDPAKPFLELVDLNSPDWDP